MLRRTFLKTMPLLGGLFIPPLRVTDPPVPTPGASRSFKALTASQFGVAEAQINLFISPNDEYAMANTPNAIIITDRDTGVRRL